MHHLPGVPADRGDFLRGAWSRCLALANGRIAHFRIELVGGFGRDTRDHAVADTDSALAADVAYEMDRALVIRRGACGDAFFPVVRSFVDPKQRIDGAGRPPAAAPSCGQRSNWRERN
jgi:hypothetical protein